MNRRHDGNAEVDQSALVADAEAAVLRDAALGDVELGHDLDARNDGGVMLLGNGLHGVLQHAVDAVLDHHIVVFRLDVDVAGAALERIENGGIDQPDDGAFVFRWSAARWKSSRRPTSSSLMRSSVNPSVASSSTRCDDSLFFRMSLICEGSQL